MASKDAASLSDSQGGRSPPAQTIVYRQRPRSRTLRTQPCSPLRRRWLVRGRSQYRCTCVLRPPACLGTSGTALVNHTPTIAPESTRTSPIFRMNSASNATILHRARREGFEHAIADRLGALQRRRSEGAEPDTHPCGPHAFSVHAGAARGCGAVAQLGERLNGIQEVGGSTPLSSIRPMPRCGPHPRRSQVRRCNGLPRFGRPYVMYKKSLTSPLNVVRKGCRQRVAVGVRGRGVMPAAMDTGRRDRNERP
jgi:hypothetical protein